MAKKTPAKMATNGKPKGGLFGGKPTSNTAPRGKSWRAGVPMHAASPGPSSGKIQAKTGQKPASTNVKYDNWSPAAQGPSTANMGDACPVTGHNAPRGNGNAANRKKGILATGSTPLAHTGTKKSAAASVSGPWM